MTDRREHAANLVSTALAQGQFQYAACFISIERSHIGARHFARPDLDAGRELAEGVTDNAPLDTDAIDARHLEGRMQQGVRECAVVGEQQQTLAIAVKSTDGKQPFLRGNQTFKFLV